MQDLEGKVAVVTGAASGIGRAVSGKLAGRGMKLVLADIEAGPLDAYAAELRDRGVDAVAVPTDVSDGAAVATLRDAALDAFGTVHVVHNNAGVGGGGPIWTIGEDDWKWVLGVNLWGVIHGIRVFVPLLVEQGEGHVVNTASMAGLLSSPFMGPYNASKHAVVTISETLFADLRLSGSPVGVSVLCPGFVQTRIHESHRNRPGYDPGADSPLAGALAQLVAGGMAVEPVAEAVVRAVEQNRFYILTHDELRPRLEDRFRRILDGDDPPSDFAFA